MMLTTYNLEFQPPDGRTDDSDICYFLKRKGRRHYEALKKELPVLKEIEEVAQEPSTPKDDADELHKALEDAKFKQLLFRSEWTGIGRFGRLLEPKMIPLNMTAAEEARLWKMYEETKICGTLPDESEKTEEEKEQQEQEAKAEAKGKNEQDEENPYMREENMTGYDPFALSLQQHYHKYKVEKCNECGYFMDNY